MSGTSDLAADTVAVVLAGGKGTRLEPLTREVCKPALPFGAAYRSIDFSLSNCVNSGIRQIGVATQYKPQPLLRHVDRVWRRALTEPGHFIAAWRGEDRAPGIGYRGTADAVYRNLDIIESLGRRLVLILAGDHVYKMDYRPMLAQHIERGATVTVGCVDVPMEEAHQFGVLSVDGMGRIDRFVEKPQALTGAGGSHVLASMGIYVFDADFLGRALRLDSVSPESRHDFGGDVLPRIIREAEAFAYRFCEPGGTGPAYWRDIGTVDAYWQAHMELLDSKPRLRLEDAGWPMPATGHATRSGFENRGRPNLQRDKVLDSLVGDGCRINGTVRQSVLSPEVEVGCGTDVAEAVVLPGAVIGRHCRLRRVIVDIGCRIPDGTDVDGETDFRAGRSGPVVLTPQGGASSSQRAAYA